MTKYPDNASGRCLCGAVRYEITAAPLSVIFCHCESCRRHTGAPIVALAGYKADQVTYTKHTPRYFSSSEGVRRAFCGDCGTPLTWEGDGGDIGPMIEILVATM
ncbi:MAG: GFA family protein, partial [Pseudomonadota bacterium]